MKRAAAVFQGLFLGLVCMGAIAADTGEKMLVLTEEEFEANLTFRERGVNILEKPTDPMAPQILVERPDLESDVIPPVEITVRFMPSEGATIDLESLKIKYGWFDITKRVLESMEVSSDGISGKIRSMRRGKYSLRVSISDSNERTSDARVIFNVVRSDDAD